ncbi:MULTISPECIES: hypothetical protein [unclassified Hahella]|uniref:hypothetical protein n=1 Tax=unclassified Hahella TaxID=2624107 RepID=UPI000FDDAD78|nr:MULTISPECIES: hypothetical protein [unclassified Hahella]AZZ93613.1 hypothetical protein ENC22_21365 [Hahella sp. KA22]MBU6955158.1 hypothetical protein [Hahella sp. HN01]MDG9671772.1 hypothetical protein [Hahella sp. CR1]QAY56987.1 hypothetical protein EUZ85_23950 [Hahella sp. KA22]
MSRIQSVKDRLQDTTEKSLIRLESIHTSIAEKPLLALGKIQPFEGVAHQARVLQQNMIHKTYRGIRDLTEMQGQIADQIIRLIP